MSEIVGLYYMLTVAAIFFHVEQMILLASIYRDNAGWHFRGSKIKGHGNLKPLASTFKIALFMFATMLVVVPITAYIFREPIIEYVETLDFHFLILPSGLVGAIFFLWHYVVKKKWNIGQVILLSISFSLMGIVLGLNYYDVILTGLDSM